MATSQEHLDALLRLPGEERARAAQALLDSLDDEEADAGDVAAEQAAELARRVRAFEGGETPLVSEADARARIAARLRQLRGQ